MSKLQTLDQICELHQEAIDYLKSYRKVCQLIPTLYEKLEKTTSHEKTSHEKKSPIAKEPKKRGADHVPLKEVIFNVLSRKENSAGLHPAEIFEIIAKEKIWQTTGDLGSMITTTISKLKSDGIISRLEDKKCRIIKKK